MYIRTGSVVRPNSLSTAASAAAAENAAAQRLQAAGYRLEGWDPRTGQRIAAQITGENTNDERRTFYAFPTWQDAAAALLG